MRRYLILDQCLRNRGRRWTWQDLLDEVNEKLAEQDEFASTIGKTTLFSDLKDIEFRVFSSEIEKIKEGRTVYLRYADPNHSINKLPLSNTEANQLKSALEILSRFNGNPAFDWISEIIPKIEDKMGLVVTKNKVMTYDHNSDYEGLGFVTALFNAIVNKRVLQITYQDFRSPVPYDVTFHPYHLRQYNSRWYIFGWNENRKRIENMALDRIKAVIESKEPFREDETDWEDFFSDMIGVTRTNNEPIEVRLLITDSEQAAYIRTKPLHQSQKPIKQVEGGFETSIKVIPNYELEKLILSFGSRVVVLAPEELKSKMAMITIEYQKHYDNGKANNIKV